MRMEAFVGVRHPAPSWHIHARAVSPARDGDDRERMRQSRIVDANDRTHGGPLVLTLAAPVPTLRWKAIPFPGVTKIDACCAFAPRPSRIIKPAFVHWFTFCTLSTRAVSSSLNESRSLVVGPGDDQIERAVAVQIGGSDRRWRSAGIQPPRLQT
jgi:hypothetical protein